MYSPADSVYLFAGLQRPLHRGARALRTSVPESDQDIASVDQTLVAGGRAARVGQFVEAGRYDLDRDPLRPRGFRRLSIHSARATSDDGRPRRQGIDVVTDPRGFGEAPASHNRNLQEDQPA